MNNSLAVVSCNVSQVGASDNDNELGADNAVEVGVGENGNNGGGDGSDVIVALPVLVAVAEETALLHKSCDLSANMESKLCGRGNMGEGVTMLLAMVVLTGGVLHADVDEDVKELLLVSLRKRNEDRSGVMESDGEIDEFKDFEKKLWC